MDKKSPDYKKHLEYAARHTFTFGEELEDFTPSERAILRKNGNWLNALATGLIPPLTDAQKRFLEVCSGNAAPTTDYESVWLKYSEYKKRQEQCRQQRAREDLEFGRRLKSISDEDLKYQYLLGKR